MRQTQPEAQRASAYSRGYNKRWQKAREDFLRAHPLCADHQQRGYLVPATIVDHIVPHKLGDALAGGNAEAIDAARSLFWRRTNWQALCKGCHDSHKQRLERGGKNIGCNLAGLPMDSSHHWFRG